MSIIQAKIVKCSDSVLNTLLRLKLIRYSGSSVLKTVVYIGSQKIGDVVVSTIQEAAEGGECEIIMCVNSVNSIDINNIKSLSITSSQEIYTDKENGIKLFPPYFQLVNIEKRD